MWKRSRRWINYCSRAMRNSRCVEPFICGKEVIMHRLHGGKLYELGKNISETPRNHHPRTVQKGKMCWILFNWSVLYELTHLLGNLELLEAIAARLKVLPSRGGTQRTITTKLHGWILRGISLYCTILLVEANIWIRVVIEFSMFPRFCTYHKWSSFNAPKSIARKRRKMHTLFPPPFYLFLIAHDCIWSPLKASLASSNFSVTTSQRSIKSSKPFFSASWAVYGAGSYQFWPRLLLIRNLRCVCIRMFISASEGCGIE